MGNGSIASVAGSHAERRLFGEATPRPVPTIRPNTPRARTPLLEPRRKPEKPLDNKEVSIWLPSPGVPTSPGQHGNGSYAPELGTPPPVVSGPGTSSSRGGCGPDPSEQPVTW